MARIDASKLRVTPGRPYPLGPIVYDEGVRFTIFSRHATKVHLLLFEYVEDMDPVWEYAFDPQMHRTGDVWSIFVRGIGEGVYFKYRMEGPFLPKEGHRFHPEKHILDPYAKAYVGDIHDNTIKCVTVHDNVDWRDFHRPSTPLKNSIIYETHVRGFTQDASSGVTHPGSYQGLIEKIPYLKELGITAVELLPIHEFGETLLGRINPETGQELVNYWGYSNIGFFAPSGRYASSATNVEHLEEFRRMVHALHNAGIEVILDVVFNHTSEGDERGPTLSFRGIDNSIYYLLDKGIYLNYSGCGNTVNCNHPLVRDFILDCLRYWVAVMHIDGFRFDLASILGRDQQGNIRQDAPLIERIAEDPVLHKTKLIAEAWDAGGAYQVGSFGDARWAEWNGQYRDLVRRYWRGDRGTRGDFASRLSGSADVYQWADRTPEHSINFITCHDGFTLYDLVAYNEKHNEANGEDNCDGANDNHSYNYGVEGDTDDIDIQVLRLRMQKNMLATLFLSLGVPMLLGGDEFGRTQQGNNNAYCQDNEISWFNWRLLEKNKELFRFCREVIAFRKENAVFSRAAYFKGHLPNTPPEAADLVWYEPSGEHVHWLSDETPVACRIHPMENNDIGLFIMFNNTDQDIDFHIPDGRWLMRIDTSRPAPNDIMKGADALPLHHRHLKVQARSLAALSTVSPFL